jgi:glycerophosphoryl diester phosphodiesterase
MTTRMRSAIVTALTCAVLLPAVPMPAAADSVQLGPRPLYLVESMDKSELKAALLACADGPFQRSSFSIGHRGAPLQFPEHSREGYLAAAAMGAGIIECDVTFTKDKELVCRHSQCDLHTTTNILAVPELAAKCTAPFTPADPAAGTKAAAKCCTSDITLAEYRTLEAKMDAADTDATTVEAYMAGTADFRTDLYSPATLMTHDDSIELLKSLGVKFTPELKSADVAMPYEGDYSQEAYAQALIDAYKAAGIDPADVFAQSFNLDDVRYWIANEPAFGAQAVYLDDRYDHDDAFDNTDPATWSPSMEELAAEGVHYIAPPMWVLVTLDDDKQIVPSPYAKAAREAGIDIITWTLERSGPLAGGGGWYYQSVNDAIDQDGDMLEMLHVLADQVGIKGIFADWPATVTYYANCMGLQ